MPAAIVKELANSAWRGTGCILGTWLRGSRVDLLDRIPSNRNHAQRWRSTVGIVLGCVMTRTLQFKSFVNRAMLLFGLGITNWRYVEKTTAASPCCGGFAESSLVEFRTSICLESGIGLSGIVHRQHRARNASVWSRSNSIRCTVCSANVAPMRTFTDHRGVHP